MFSMKIFFFSSLTLCHEFQFSEMYRSSYFVCFFFLSSSIFVFQKAVFRLFFPSDWQRRPNQMNTFLWLPIFAFVIFSLSMYVFSIYCYTVEGLMFMSLFFSTSLFLVRNFLIRLQCSLEYCCSLIPMAWLHRGLWIMTETVTSLTDIYYSGMMKHHHYSFHFLFVCFIFDVFFRLPWLSSLCAYYFDFFFSSFLCVSLFCARAGHRVSFPMIFTVAWLFDKRIRRFAIWEHLRHIDICSWFED